MSLKPSSKKRKSNLIVSEGRTWRVEYDRIGKTFLAMINGVGCIGTATKPHEAQALINEYNFEQLRRAA